MEARILLFAAVAVTVVFTFVNGKPIRRIVDPEVEEPRAKESELVVSKIAFPMAPRS